MIIMQINLNDHIFIFPNLGFCQTVNDNSLLKILYIYNTTLGNSFTEEMYLQSQKNFRNTFIPLILLRII